MFVYWQDEISNHIVPLIRRTFFFTESGMMSFEIGYFITDIVEVRSDKEFPGMGMFIQLIYY
jgi:hypothetical protein